MSLSISNKTLRNIYVLVPFVLIFIGAIFLKVHHTTGSILKMIAFVYMISYIVIHRKVNRNLIQISLLFFVFLLYGIAKSFSIQAGIEDGIRYLFPIVSLFYGYSIREHFELILKFIVFFIIINFLAQFVNYYFWHQGVKQWFYHVTPSGLWYYNRAAGILRASGIVVYFCFFGFMNMIAYFLLKKYYSGKYKIWLLGIALSMFLLSLSFKTIISFVIVLIVYYHKKVINLFTGVVLFVIVTLGAFPTQSKILLNDLIYRADAYLFMSKPTLRAETYVLMWKEISNFNLFGHGVGSFGGPGSLKYDSPYYASVNFKWLDTFWMKMTTVDTFPPHVFIELGIVGGLLFFLVLLTPLIKKRVSAMVLIIYFTLFFDMLFTFSLANLEYMMFSFVLVYPIYFYEEKQRT